MRLLKSHKQAMMTGRARDGSWRVRSLVSSLYKWYLKPGERLSSLGEKVQPITEGWALQHLEGGEMRVKQRRNNCEGDAGPNVS